MLFPDKIKQLREEKQLLQRQVSAYLEMDNALFCKIERGERRAKREQVIILAELFKVEEKELLQLWLADKIEDLIANDTPEVTNSAMRLVSNKKNKLL